MDPVTTAARATPIVEEGIDRKHKLVIFASSLGTVFEWYDFYIFGTLAAFFGKLFFPAGNETAAYLSSLALFGVGFSVRPFGALVFGRIGDLVGRKYTFLVTIMVMGLSTAVIGFLPSFATIGWAAPIILVLLRLALASRSAANTAAPRRTWPSTRRTASAAFSPAGSKPRRRSGCFFRSA